MLRSIRLRATALGAFLVLASAPAGAAVPAESPVGALPDLGPGVTVQRLSPGGTLIVRPAVGAPVAAVELWYRAPSTGFGPKPVPSLARLAAQVVAASKPLIGDSLGKVIGDMGGRLTITVYSDSVAVAAVVPAFGAPAAVKAMTTAFFAPVVTEDGFHSAERDVEQEALFTGFDPETVVRDAVFGALFSEGPQHYPALGDAKGVTTIELADVKAFAIRAFRSQNATLVVSGSVDPSIAASAVGGRIDAGDANPEAPSPPTLAAAVEPVSKSFVQPTGGYGWVGPAIANEREATAMDFIADYLFRSDDGLVSKQVAKQYPDAFIVGNFITLHDPGVMFVAYSGKPIDSVKALVDDGFARVRVPLDARAFAAALAGFEYHMRADLQTPTEIADNFGWYSVEGAPAYAPGVDGDDGAYFKYASGLTPDFVASRRAEVSREAARRDHARAERGRCESEIAMIAFRCAPPRPSRRRSDSLALLGLSAAAPPPTTRYPQAFAIRRSASTTADRGDGCRTRRSAACRSSSRPASTASRRIKSGVSALVAECVLAHARSTALPLRDAIAARGGSVSYTVDGRSVHYYLEGEPRAVCPQP